MSILFPVSLPSFIKNAKRNTAKLMVYNIGKHGVYFLSLN